MNSINDSFTIPSKVFDWGKWWLEMSSIQRQNWLRYWRLERIEYLRQEGFNMQLLEECKLNYLSNATKIFINGAIFSAN